MPAACPSHLGERLQACNGRFFYVRVPIVKHRDSWAFKFRELLVSKSFDVPFMYSCADATAARIVFAVYNASKPNINTIGLATLISRAFPWVLNPSPSDRHHIPIIALPNRIHLAIALAHVGCNRLSLSGQRDHLKGSAGDVGDDVARLATEMTRATSFPRIMQCFVAQLQDSKMHNEVKKRIEEKLISRGLGSPFDVQLPVSECGPLYHYDKNADYHQNLHRLPNAG